MLTQRVQVKKHKRDIPTPADVAKNRARNLSPLIKRLKVTVLDALDNAVTYPVKVEVKSPERYPQEAISAVIAEVVASNWVVDYKPGDSVLTITPREVDP